MMCLSSYSKNTNLNVVLTLLMLIATTTLCESFTNPSLLPQHSSHLCSGFGKNIKSTTEVTSKSFNQQELFELQELRAQLRTMTDKNILYQSISDEKRSELTKYVNAVVEKSDSPVDVSGKRNSMGPMQFVAGIENKSWRMVFNTSNGSSGGTTDTGLPYGSTVMFRIGELHGARGSLDYVLKFSKQVMGLQELVAKSSCQVDVSTSMFKFSFS